MFQQIRDELIFKAGYIGESVGLNKSMGQLYAALYFSKNPLSLEELAHICRMSKGNASINIRRLEFWGAAKKVWQSEDRKDYYEANRDILGFSLNHGSRVIKDILGQVEEIMVSSKRKLAKLNTSELDERQNDEVRLYDKNLTELEELAAKIKVIVNNLKIFESMIK